MSAHLVSADHIQYLVDAATSRAVAPYGVRWTAADGESRTLRISDYKDATAVGQMLWTENDLSVAYRYSEAPQGVVFKRRHITGPFDPVKVLAACATYRYQACERPTYQESEAEAFICALERSAIYALTANVSGRVEVEEGRFGASWKREETEAAALAA